MERWCYQVRRSYLETWCYMETWCDEVRRSYQVRRGYLVRQQRALGREWMLFPSTMKILSSARA